MATIVFAAAAAEAGAMTMAIATTIGSIIDNQFIFPALFPADPIESNRMDSIQIMGADAGHPVSYCLGLNAKTGGFLFWAGELQEHILNERTGKNMTRVTYNYSLDCAIAACKVRPGEAITTFDRVYADEKLIKDKLRGGDFTFVETGLMCWNDTPDVYVLCDPKVNATVVEDVYDRVNVGDKITWSDWQADANVNNDANDVVKAKTTVTLEYRETTGGPILTEEFQALQMTERKNYEFDGEFVGGYFGVDYAITGEVNRSEGWADDIQMGGESDPPEEFLGNNSETFDRMVDAQGELHVPNYKDVAYIGFDDLNLDDFGFRIPNFEFVITQSSTATGQDLIEDILLLGEIPSAWYDVSGLDSLTDIYGYTMKGMTETAKALQPIMLFDNIVAQERGGKIYFIERADATTVSIDEEDLGAYVGEKSVAKVEVQEIPATEKLGEVIVGFIDRSDDDLFPAGSESAQVFTDSSTTNTLHSPNRHGKLRVNFPITTTPSKAREVAKRLLYSTWCDDMKFSFQLPPKYARLQENDRVTIEVNDLEYTAIIQKIDFGANHLMAVEASLDVSVNLDMS